MTRQVHWVGVVVPARDEEELLPGALAALDVARRVVWRRHRVPVDVAVVLDGCRDRSPDVVAAHPWVVPVSGPGRGVGAARAAGSDELLRRHRHEPFDAGWLATTDADSRVPADWLSVQVALAGRGSDVVLGTVRVDDWSSHPEGVEGRWRRTYTSGDGHGHVHGANVGLRVSAYLAVGGFAAVARDEDVALAAAVAHREVTRTGVIPVVTSGRTGGRTVGGFADHLARLA